MSFITFFWQIKNIKLHLVTDIKYWIGFKTRVVNEFDYPVRTAWGFSAGENQKIKIIKDKNKIEDSVVHFMDFVGIS